MKKIYVIGTGPGSIDEMTCRARYALDESDWIFGYRVYVDLIKSKFPGKNFKTTGMTGEVQRCIMALDKAREGNTVALISGGDSGIYGMAGLMLEIALRQDSSIPVEIIPGITAASAAASVLGAPLMHDFAVISLSDCLTEWELILKRIRSAASADFVICFYNPKSKRRKDYISIARDELISFRKPSTPVGIVWNAGRSNEYKAITSLDRMLEHEIDMFSTVIVGNSCTYVGNGKIITPRGYNIDGGK